MKHSLQRLAVLLLLGFLALPISARASDTSILYSEDFSSGNYPPDGWTDNSYYQGGFPGDGNPSWYTSKAGFGDYNGSLGADEWNYSFGYMQTPTVDLSSYALPNDKAFVDFDLFFEKSLYHDPSQRDDHFLIHFLTGRNDSTAVDVNSSTDFTYFYDAADYHPDPLTDESAWRHYHLPVPIGWRASDFSIAFEGAPGQGLSNPFIDNVVITGTHNYILGVTPKTNLNFGSVLYGNSSGIQCIYLSNPNNIPIDLSNFNLVNGSEFTLLSAPSSVAPGSFDTPTLDSICFQFTPAAGGARTGSFTFTNSGDGASTITVNFAGFGLAPILSVPTAPLFVRTKTSLGSSRSQSILVTNTGVGNLTISPSSYIGGDYPGEYSITRIPGPIAPEQSDTLTVTYTPTIEGSHPAELYLLSNGGSAPAISLRGTGIVPHLVVTPTSYSFDSVAIYTEACEKFTLTNTGSDTLIVTKAFLSSSDYDFTMTGLGNDNRIAPDQSRTVTVCFTPLKNGTRLATLRIQTNIPGTFESPSRDTSAIDIQIRGIGVPYGRLAIGGVGIDSIIVNTTLCHTDTISNTGLSDLVINGASLVGGNASDFAFSGITFPVVIKPGSSQTFNFCVTPSARGQRGSMLVLNSTNSGVTSDINIPVFTFGQEVCASTNAQTLFSGVKTLVAQSDTELVSVTNCGDIATAYTGAITTGASDYTILGSASTPVVAPGQSTTIQVVFHPTTIAASNGVLHITGGAGVTPMDVNLLGSGAGVIAQASGQAGDVMVGDCKTFDVTITNNGNVDWTPGTAALAGTNAADFTIVSGPTPATIAAGSSCTVTVKFCPTTTSEESTVLTFPTSAPAVQGGFNFTINGTGAVSGVSTVTTEAGITLEQSYPNPTLGSTQIRFTLPTSAAIRLDVVDQKGNLVKMVMNERASAGEHIATVDASGLASGTYFYILTSGDVRLARQMVVIK